LWEAARDSQAEAAHREEIRTMSETIEQTWEQELLAEGELRTRRQILRELIEDRFGSVPESLALRIEQTQDPERLRQCIRQVWHVRELAELPL
jgi:hypothetical protein